ncbi:MAG: DUF4827 domain-containing protein [Prevotellaceae bacterium]|nr:DUF4827 domain-containing protein [Prevotellaceae bacterium]
MNIRKYTLSALALLIVAGFALSACDDDETYAEQKEKERKAINAFLQRDPLVLTDGGDDTLLCTGKIKVISETVFEAQDSTTNVDENEYVLFNNSGVYMQIVRRGPGEKLQSGETATIICRYYEYNILGDSLQTTDMTSYYINNPEIISASNNSGTITASFDISNDHLPGAMYLVYASTVVPDGWIVPLSYVNIGRQTTPDEGIAKVRLIVPHSQGTSDATGNVYPCFYEITYQKRR